MYRGAWQATVHRVAKSRTCLVHAADEGNVSSAYAQLLPMLRTRLVPVAWTLGQSGSSQGVLLGPSSSLKVRGLSAAHLSPSLKQPGCCTAGAVELPGPLGTLLGSAQWILASPSPSWNGGPHSSHYIPHKHGNSVYLFIPVGDELQKAVDYLPLHP